MNLILQKYFKITKNKNEIPRYSPYYFLQNFGAIQARLCAYTNHVVSLHVQHAFHLFDGQLDFGRLQVDFVYDGYNVNARLEGCKKVGYCLSLHAFDFDFD